MKQNENFIIKGDILDCASPKELGCHEGSFLLCVDGKSGGIFSEIPEKYRNLQVLDCSGKLVMSGLVDLHLHAPQYGNRGMGMDMELLDWLETYTFPEEGRYAQKDFAQKAYTLFVEDLKKSATTRFSAFGTAHKEGTILLMKLLEEAGLSGLVGLVSMNRNAPDFLCQEKPVELLQEWLDEWLEECTQFQQIKPILTPRFIPSCTDDLMKEIGRIQKETGLALQSHLSENLGEMAWVSELVPQSAFYGDAYEKFGCFGGEKKEQKVVMAHCVHSTPEEVNLMKKNGVFVAHCPQSNSNLSSGIAPIRHYLNEGISVGFGSDVAGGHNLSIFAQMADGIAVSKLRWRLVDQTLAPLTVAEVLYMGTKGGGGFFGEHVGSLQKGDDFDVIVLEEVESLNSLDMTQRAERVIYLGCEVVHKFVCGRRIF